MRYSTRRPSFPSKLSWLIIALALQPVHADADPHPADSRQASAASCQFIPAGTILRVDSPERIKLSSLRAGDTLSAVLPSPLFSGECQVLPAGTPLRLHVAEVTRVKEGGESSRSWTSGLRKPFESLFPRHKDRVEFRSSEIVMADGSTVAFHPSLLDVRELGVVMTRNTGREATPEPSGEAAGDAASDGSMHGPARNRRGSSLMISLKSPVTLPRQATGTGDSNAAAERSRAKETRVRLRLLQPLSARRNETGQTFLARILEPLQLGDQALVPEGSTIQGTIVQRKTPRRLRRAGQLRLAFGRVNLPDGEAIDLDASVTALEALRGSRITLDKEGTLRASAATKKRAALDLGLAYVVGKVVDDVLEKSIKAGASAAATGAITTVARYVGLAAGTALFFAHRGRDVSLPEYTELEIVVTRPESVGRTAESEPASSE